MCQVLDDGTKLTYRMHNANSLYRLLSSKIWLLDPLLASKWIQLLDPLIALPCTNLNKNIRKHLQLSSKLVFWKAVPRAFVLSETFSSEAQSNQDGRLILKRFLKRDSQRLQRQTAATWRLVNQFFPTFWSFSTDGYERSVTCTDTFFDHLLLCNRSLIA